MSLLSLYPQIRLQQQLVVDHVKQQAVQEGLGAAEAATLLATTLAHNGLPPVQSNPVAAVLNGVSQVTDINIGGCLQWGMRNLRLLQSEYNVTAMLLFVTAG